MTMNQEGYPVFKGLQLKGVTLQPLHGKALHGRDLWHLDCRAELFAREQAVENRTACDSLVILEKQPCLLENALLAAGLEVEDDVLGGE